MLKSFRKLTLLGLTAMMLLGSGQTASAGIIPWTYNAIFGPVGSTFAPRRSFYAPSSGFGACCNPVPTCGTCNTCNYGSFYSPYESYYGSYNYGCSSCGNTGCQSCGFGCASGNCPSGNCSTLAPATGITPTPATETPTQTFQSSRPTVDPDKVDINNGNFEEPSRPNNNGNNGNNGTNNSNGSSNNTDAPGFNPFGSSSTTNESLKVPAAPMVPVPKRQPAPAELEGNGDLQLPTLRLEPAPVAVDESNISWTRTTAPTRMVRTARYEVPTVARSDSGRGYDLLPPLPGPVQLVGK